jgi:hypothetical protein
MVDLLEFKASHNLDGHAEFRGLLFERVAASGDSHSFLNHFRHLGIEVYPDHGAGRVAVRDGFAQRPSPPQ